MASLRDLSLWRVPNHFMESRDGFLGEPVAHVKTLAKWRTWLGLLTIGGAAVVYPAIAREQPNQFAGPAGHSNAFYYANYFLNWAVGILAAVVMTAFYLIVVSLGLLLAVHAKRAVLKRLTRPLLALASFFALFGAAGGIAAIVQPCSAWAKRQSLAVHALVSIGEAAMLVIALVWMVKALYLAAVDVFRADDGHPMLGPIVTTAVVWTMAVIALAEGGTVGVPQDIGVALAFGGPVSVTALNVYTGVMISRKYGTLLFRGGPPTGSVPRKHG